MRYKLGDNVKIKKSFSQQDVIAFGKLSEDTNQIHYDQKFSEETFFKQNIVQGPLVSSLFGGLLGSKLPGTGTILLGQTLKYLKPVYIDEEVIAEIKIINIREDKPIITFGAMLTKNNGDIAIEGEMVIKI